MNLKPVPPERLSSCSALGPRLAQYSLGLGLLLGVCLTPLALALPAEQMSTLTTTLVAPTLIPSHIGPVHEAFASPLPSHGPRKMIMVAPPPTPIELIPAKRPQGGPLWIPGYWFWDEINLSYLWVGGCWRHPPENRTWVPGFWKVNGTICAWYPGYWATAGLANAPGEEPIHPPTKPPLDPQDPGKPPDPERVAYPGHWAWNGSQHFWQPGTWTKMSQGFLWIPPHNVPVPNGVLTNSGYWDYALWNRGLASAPSRILRFPPEGSNGPVQPVWFWRTQQAMQHLFVHEPATHYLFGDYYAPQLFRFGIASGLDYSRHKCDPLFSVERARHRTSVSWEGQAIKRQLDIQMGKIPRPSLPPMQSEVPKDLTNASNKVSQPDNLSLVGPLEQTAFELGMELVSVKESEQAKMIQERDRILALAKQRPSQTAGPKNLLGSPLKVKRMETIDANRLPGLDISKTFGKIVPKETDSSEGGPGTASPLSRRMEATQIKDLKGEPIRPFVNPLSKEGKRLPIVLPTNAKVLPTNAKVLPTNAKKVAGSP